MIIFTLFRLIWFQVAYVYVYDLKIKKNYDREVRGKAVDSAWVLEYDHGGESEGMEGESWGWEGVGVR